MRLLFVIRLLTRRNYYLALYGNVINAEACYTSVLRNLFLYDKKNFYFFVNDVLADLFHRGISQSGTSHCPWTLTPPGIAKKHAKILGKKLGCPTTSSEKLIACLKKKSAVDIIGIDREFQVITFIDIKNLYRQLILKNQLLRVSLFCFMPS